MRLVWITWRSSLTGVPWLPPSWVPRTWATVHVVAWSNGTTAARYRVYRRSVPARCQSAPCRSPPLPNRRRSTRPDHTTRMAGALRRSAPTNSQFSCSAHRSSATFPPRPTPPVRAAPTCRSTSSPARGPRRGRIGPTLLVRGDKHRRRSARCRSQYARTSNFCGGVIFVANNDSTAAARNSSVASSSARIASNNSVKLESVGGFRT